MARTNGRKALTLVELMAALAIASMLMVAAMRATVGISRSQRLIHRQTDPAVRTGIEDLLRVDLLHAQRYRRTSEGFEMQTTASLNPRTYELEHIRSTVTYEVKRIATRSVLVRRQEPEATGKGFSELVCLSVRGITVKAEGSSEGRLGLWKPIPQAAIVTIGFERPGGAWRTEDFRFQVR